MSLNLKLEQLFSECENKFIEQLKLGLSDNVESVLLKIKEDIKSTKDYDQKLELQQNYQILKTNKIQIVNEFEKVISNMFNQKNQAPKKTLFLVSKEEEEVFNFKMNLERKILSSMSNDVEALNIRLQSIDNKKYNLFSTKNVIMALSESSENFFKKVDVKNKSKIITEMGNNLQDTIVDSYKHLNGFLVTKNIIPNIAAYKQAHQVLPMELFSDELLTDVERKVKFEKKDNKIKNEQVVNTQEVFLPPLNSLPTIQMITREVDNAKINIGENVNISIKGSDFNTVQTGFIKPNGLSNRNESILPVDADNSVDNQEAKEEIKNLSIEDLNKMEKAKKVADFLLNNNDAIDGIYKRIFNANSLLNEDNVKVKSNRLMDIDVESIVLTNQKLISSLNDLQKRFITIQDQNTKIINHYASVKLNDLIKNENTAIEHKNIIQDITNDSLLNETLNDSNNPLVKREKMLLDVLKGLFSKIFEHERIAEHTKMIVGKLQIPMVKVCLKDDSFFVDINNPIRSFLNFIGQNETLYKEEVQEKFIKIIDGILNKNEIDINTFAIGLNDIKEIVSTTIDKTEKFVNSINVNLQKEELSQLSINKINNYLDSVVKRINYNPIKMFIETTWASAFAKKWGHLIKTDLNRDLPLEARVILNQSLLVFDMMVWSTNKKEKSLTNIEKMKNFIPKISISITNIGIDLDIDKKSLDSIMFLLAEKHIQFIRQVESQEPSLEEENAVKIFKNNIKKFEHIQESNKEIIKSSIDFKKLFTKGTWYEFGDDNQKINLLWISPQETIYLFFDPQNKKVYKFEKTKVWELYKNKQIKSFANKSSFSVSELLVETVNDLDVKKNSMFR